MSFKRREMPDTASIANPEEGGKLSAPSAVRNVEAILQAIGPYVPASGIALEIASGTGEHMMRFAATFSDIIWQPTDVEQDRLDSIAAWNSDVVLPNILAPKFLNATVDGWAVQNSGQDVIILSNLLHLISEPEVQMLISQSAKALGTGGVFLIYGPFLRGTEFASEGDRSFHESLQSKDPEIGYKSFQLVQALQSNAGLTVAEPVEMPSNNLLLVARRE